MEPSPLHRPTWAEIDLDNLAFNYHSVRDFVGRDVKCMAVIKADAYGHGAVECGTRLEREGANWFAVATVEEGCELRRAGISIPILILGGFWPGQIDTALDNGLTPAVFTLEQASEINAAAAKRDHPAKVHFKIDTGMGRVGFRWDSISQISNSIVQLQNIEIEGLMTHFAAADDLSSDFTSIQTERFSQCVAALRHVGIEPKYTDLANSPGAVAHPQTRSDLVRIGGVLYGLGSDVLPRGIETPELRPVMSIRSRIAQIKTVATGESIGYSRTFVAKRETKVATVPIGYHDGFRRGLSNISKFLINGFSAPVIGRVSMDWTTIDVTDIPSAKAGDQVTIIGSNGSLRIKAEDIARELGTISYEVTCGIGRRIPRIFTGENKL